MFTFDNKNLFWQTICFFWIPLLIDRATKYFIVHDIITSQYVCEFFNVYKTFNAGIAWGIGNDLHTSQAIWLLCFIAIVLLYFIWYMRHILHSTVLTIACLLILSGGISNFADRCFYDGVVDFMQFHVGQYFFPVFNFADVCISIGAALLLYGIITDRHDV